MKRTTYDEIIKSLMSQGQMAAQPAQSFAPQMQEGVMTRPAMMLPETQEMPNMEDLQMILGQPVAKQPQFAPKTKPHVMKRYVG